MATIRTNYFNQILTAVLEVLDDPDSSIRELAITLILEMLNNQRENMEDSVEIVIEKLLHAARDMVAKVSSEAEHCLTVVLTQYDPHRCLAVLAPLLVSEDEKTLVTCINCLTKVVGRFSQEELMAQLPSFLPALFDAFGNQSADVRKTVVFCLVDIYIMLGKAFLPYLERLNSSQLRLVTIYANRISQARSGASIDASNEWKTGNLGLHRSQPSAILKQKIRRSGHPNERACLTCFTDRPRKGGVGPPAGKTH
ncbi:hypothetical protein ACLOJK_011163 [Asimina triloba]